MNHFLYQPTHQQHLPHFQVLPNSILQSLPALQTRTFGPQVCSHSFSQIEIYLKLFFSDLPYLCTEQNLNWNVNFWFCEKWNLSRTRLKIEVNGKGSSIHDGSTLFPAQLSFSPTRRPKKMPSWATFTAELAGFGVKSKNGFLEASEAGTLSNILATWHRTPGS